MAELQNEYEDDLDDDYEGSEDEEDGLPKRGEDKYKEIEDFKLYEFTHCKAYEMAIRNNEVKRILQELDTLTLNMKPLLIGFNTENASETVLIGQRIAELTMTLEEKYYVVYDAEKQMLSKENYENLNILNHREPNIEIASFLENIYLLQEDEYKSNGIVNDGFAVMQGAYQDSEGFDVNIIVPNFKKPMRVFNQTQVALNLSLPIEQIKDFIEVIKNHYDQENSSIQNIKQLLGLEFDEDYKELVSMKQKEWADCFFIYDFFNASSDKNISTKEQKLQEILTKHHGVKVLKKGENKNEYETVSYQTYLDMIRISDNKDEFQIYRLANKDDQDAEKKDKYVKKEYQAYLSKKTIGKRLKLMEALIDNAKYKIFLVN